VRCDWCEAASDNSSFLQALHTPWASVGANRLIGNYCSSAELEEESQFSCFLFPSTVHPFLPFCLIWLFPWFYYSLHRFISLRPISLVKKVVYFPYVSSNFNFQVLYNKKYVCTSCFLPSDRHFWMVDFYDQFIFLIIFKFSPSFRLQNAIKHNIWFKTWTC